MGRAQRRESAHAVAERPGAGRAGRGGVSPRRGDRRRLVTHAAARAGAGLVPGPARRGLHHVSPPLPGTRPAAPHVRSGGRSGEDRPAAGDQSPRSPPSLDRHLLRRVGARGDARHDAGVRRPGVRPRIGSAARAQPLEHGLRRPHRVRGGEREAPRADGRPHRVPGPAREPRRSRRPSGASASRAPFAPASIRARRSRSTSISRRARRRTCTSCSARPAPATRRPR